MPDQTTIQPSRRWNLTAVEGRIELKLLAVADGYVMVRRPGCMPFVLSEKGWLLLPPVEGTNK